LQEERATAFSESHGGGKTPALPSGTEGEKMGHKKDCSDLALLRRLTADERARIETEYDRFTKRDPESVWQESEMPEKAWLRLLGYDHEQIDSLQYPVTQFMQPPQCLRESSVIANFRKLLIKAHPDKNRGSDVSSECHTEWTARLVAAKEIALQQLKCRPVEHT
jgi:hypothetical protein